MVPASTPHTGAIASGVASRTESRSASNSAVRSRTKASSTRPSVTTTLSIALSSATSVSARNCSTCVAWRARSVRRGSATTSFAPARAAFLMKVAATGWLTVGFAPITRMSSAASTSETGLETAPDPMPSSSAATLDAWHSRVQWSTLCVPKPIRTSFWNR